MNKTGCLYCGKPSVFCLTYKWSMTNVVKNFPTYYGVSAASYSMKTCKKDLPKFKAAMKQLGFDLSHLVGEVQNLEPRIKDEEIPF